MSSNADVLRYVLAAFMTGMGLLHFVQPVGFVKIVPSFLPARMLLVYVSGVCEIALGLALLVPSLQTLAAWGLIALFIAVFPANVYQALNRVPYGVWKAPAWLLWARLPLQAVFIAWAYALRK